MDLLHPASSGASAIYGLAAHEGTIWAVGGTYGEPLVMVSVAGDGFLPLPSPKVLGLRDVLPISADRVLLAGESGGLFSTNDRGQSWKKITTKTTGCLFSLTRVQHSLWLGGDAGFVLRSDDDGKTWSPPAFAKKAKQLGRISRIVAHGSDVWFVSHSGKLGVARQGGPALDVIELDSDPLCALAFSPSGHGLTVGDRGTAFWSTDKGATWEPAETGLDLDLEDAAWFVDRFVMIGEDATVLTTANGRQFSALKSARTEHFWSVFVEENALVIGADESLVAVVSQSAFANSR